MPTILFRIIIVVLVATTISCIKANEKSALIPEKPSKLSAKNRHGRTTYVKAILSNPKLSPTHILAEKLAKETLRSPRTQQTLKKLTEIRSPVEKRSTKRANSGKHHKKRKRKKHKHRKGSHRHHHHHHRRRRLDKQVSGNDETKRRNDLPSNKIQVKRNDIDCTVTRLNYLNPLRHPLPISDPFYPESSRVRISRAVSNKPSKKTIKDKQKRQRRVNNFDNSGFNQNILPYSDPYSYPGPQLSNFNENPSLYPQEYNLPQFPMNPTGLYSFERQPNYPPQFNQSPNRPISTRALHITKHDVTHENSTSNCTATKSEVNPEAIKNEEQIKEAEYNSSGTSNPPGEALAPQSQSNFTGLETKQVANEILNEIIEELEDLKVDHNRNNPREGLACKVSGSWTTTQAGVEMKITVANHSLVVTLEKMNPSMKLHSGILNTTWNITGHMPFKRGAPFALVATNIYIKSLATFVGACRVCQGVDTIEGVWSVIREPRGCRDLQASTSAYNDIFRRVIPTPKTKRKKSVITR